MGLLGYDRPDSAYAIGGTAELALRYSNYLSRHHTTRPSHFQVTTGRPDCRSKGNAASFARAAGSFYETTGQRKQQVAATELSVPQDLSKDYNLMHAVLYSSTRV